MGLGLRVCVCVSVCLCGFEVLGFRVHFQKLGLGAPAPEPTS